MALQAHEIFTRNSGVLKPTGFIAAVKEKFNLQINNQVHDFIYHFLDAIQ
jgi:hypothetical protein